MDKRVKDLISLVESQIDNSIETKIRTIIGKIKNLKIGVFDVKISYDKDKNILIKFKYSLADEHFDLIQEALMKDKSLKIKDIFIGNDAKTLTLVI